MSENDSRYHSKRRSRIRDLIAHLRDVVHKMTSPRRFWVVYSRCEGDLSDEFELFAVKRARPSAGPFQLLFAGDQGGWRQNANGRASRNRTAAGKSGSA